MSLIQNMASLSSNVLAIGEFTSEQISNLLIAFIPALITGGLAFLGVVITKRTDRRNAQDQNEVDVAKTTYSNAVDMIEMYHKEIAEVKEALKETNAKYEEKLEELTNLKIEVTKLIQQNEELSAKNEELLNKNEELQKKNEELSITNHELIKQNQVLLAKLEKFDK